MAQSRQHRTRCKICGYKIADSIFKRHLKGHTRQERASWPGGEEELKRVRRKVRRRLAKQEARSRRRERDDDDGFLDTIGGWVDVASNVASIFFGTG